jgi:alpha-beta hydrolase superfamily lysophospholipase
VPITDAKHDVFLSLAEPRAAAYAELDRWLEQL